MISPLDVQLLLDICSNKSVGIWLRKYIFARWINIQLLLFEMRIRRLSILCLKYPFFCSDEFIWFKSSKKKWFKSSKKIYKISQELLETVIIIPLFLKVDTLSGYAWNFFEEWQPATCRFSNEFHNKSW